MPDQLSDYYLAAAFCAVLGVVISLIASGRGKLLWCLLFAGVSSLVGERVGISSPPLHIPHTPSKREILFLTALACYVAHLIFRWHLSEKSPEDSRLRALMNLFHAAGWILMIYCNQRSN